MSKGEADLLFLWQVLDMCLGIKDALYLWLRHFIELAYLISSYSDTINQH